MVIPQSIILFGVTFHTYGLILGITGVLSVQLAKYAAVRASISSVLVQKYIVVAIIGGVLGARLWHVFTDWPLYANEYASILKIWNGGLSIIGALIGLFVGLSIYQNFRKRLARETVSLLALADVVALSLPIGQAVGRFANYINQEVYGLPTQLPWGIFISSANRVRGYDQFARFHPLFAYEALVMLTVGCVLWCLHRSSAKQWSIGRGNLGIVYILTYSAARVLLDFLRIGIVRYGSLGLSLNQVFLLLLLATVSVFALRPRGKKVYE